MTAATLSLNTTAMTTSRANTSIVPDGTFLFAVRSVDKQLDHAEVEVVAWLCSPTYGVLLHRQPQLGHGIPEV